MGSQSQFQHTINTVLIIKLFKTTYKKKFCFVFLRSIINVYPKAPADLRITRTLIGFGNFLPSV